MATDDTARQLRDAVRRLVVAHGALEEARRPCGTPLSMPHAYALLELVYRKQPMTVSELAATLAIDRTNVSRLCARMEQDGELVRRPHPDDRRAVALHLTTAGKKLARTVDRTSAHHFADLVERLGDTTDEVVDALNVLERAMAPEVDDQ